MQTSGTLLDSFTIPVAAEIQSFPSGPNTCPDTGPPYSPPSRSSEELSRLLGPCTLSVSRLGVKTWHPPLEKLQPNLGE